MNFPRVFILVRNYEELYPCTFEDFRDNIAELNFLDPKERGMEDEIDILIDAWNFLSLQEAAVRIAMFPDTLSLSFQILLQYF